MEEDETIPDKESDIKPRFHKSKTHSVGGKTDGEEVRHWPGKRPSVHYCTLAACLGVVHLVLLHCMSPC